MEQNTTESIQEAPVPAPKHRRRRKVLYWLAADLLVAVTVIVLLFHTPAGYTPNTTVTGPNTPQDIQDYWSRLGVEIYNQAQRGQPFDLIIDQNRVNEAIQQERWPIVSDNIKLYAPTATFQADHVQLMSTVEFQGAELVVTLRLDANIDPNNQAHLDITTIKIGAMNITPVAMLMARKAYQQQAAFMSIDPGRIETRIASALLDNTSFDPAFYVRNTDRRRAHVRVSDIAFRAGSVIARIIPIQ